MLTLRSRGAGGAAGAESGDCPEVQGAAQRERDSRATGGAAGTGTGVWQAISGEAAATRR